MKCWSKAWFSRPRLSAVKSWNGCILCSRNTSQLFRDICIFSVWLLWGSILFQKDWSTFSAILASTIPGQRSDSQYLYACSRRARSEHKTPLRSRAAISLLQKAQRQRFIISGITSNCIRFKSPLFRNPPAARYSRKCVEDKHFKSLPFATKTIRNWFNKSTRSSTA